jgi:hypothetical protein
MADLALRVVGDYRSAYCELYTYDGLADRLRQVPVSPRSTCPLCSPSPAIAQIDEARYTNPTCAA